MSKRKLAARPRRRHLASAFFLALLLVVPPAIGAQERSAAKLTTQAPVALSLAPAQAASKEVTVFGQKINYIEAGSGPIVILLHGLGGSTANWALNVPALATKFRVIVPDQIGHGQSAKPLINYRIGTYVDFLDKFLSELKIERASLVGNSMGGWIASAYALKYPQRVERIVLVDAAGFSPPKEYDLAALNGLNPSTRDGMRQLAQLVFFNKALFASDAALDLMLTARLSAGDGYTIQSLVESFNRREDMLDGKLSALKQPVLLVWGREDGLTPLAREGEQYKREIPHAQLVVFEQCGHIPQVEKAMEFNAAVLKFLTASS
jgi:2-hydroxy-6-oxonona-2,4-dienedioate hydrolase